MRQADDALVINLAGRQRMLTQRMTWLALVQPNNSELPAAINQFEQTLSALIYGGTTFDASGNPVKLPPPPDAELAAQLQEVQKTWKGFQTQLQSPDSEQLPILASTILTQLDEIVSAFEARAEIKQQRLGLIQIVFLLAALLLLAWGFITTRSRIISPLAALGDAVRIIGTGDLQTPLPSIADDEFGELATAFDSMRAELAASQRLLEDKVDQRTRELSAAFEFSQEIVAQRDLETLMTSVIERTRVLMDAQSAALCILTSDGSELEMMASSGENVPLPGLRQSIKRGIALPVIVEGQTVIENTVCADCGFLAAQKTGGCAATPLSAADQTNRALGSVFTRNPLGR